MRNMRSGASIRVVRDSTAFSVRIVIQYVYNSATDDAHYSIVGYTKGGQRLSSIRICSLPELLSRCREAGIDLRESTCIPQDDRQTCIVFGATLNLDASKLAALGIGPQ